MAEIRDGNGTSGLANVKNFSIWTTLRNSIGNVFTKKTRDQYLTTDEVLPIGGKNDENIMPIRVDRNGNIVTGNFIPEIIENFEGTALNVQRWAATNTTFAPTLSTVNGYSFNPTNLTTANAVAILQSVRLINKFIRVPLQYKSRKRHSLVSNSVADFGFGVPTGTTLIVPNGVCFRINSSGVIQGVITYNGTENLVTVKSLVASNGNTIGGDLNMSNSYYTSNYFVYDLIVDDDNATFTVQDTSTNELIGFLEISVPNTVQKMFGATAVPVYERLYNTATPPVTSPVYILTDLICLSTDTNINLNASQLAANLGLSAGRNPFTGAALENHTNSTAPASATLSNTAAGYTTLGGRWQFAAVAGAVTDYALFAFTVPAGSRFLCEGVTIHSYNTGAVVATTTTVLEWALGFNSTAVSLTTANIIRRQVGVQSFPVGAAIGADAKVLDLTLDTPEVVDSGRILHVILNMPIGTATASQIIRGQVIIKGRFI